VAKAEPKRALKAEEEKPDLLIEEAYQRAKDVLEKCSTPNGIFASPIVYNAIYARDALIASLGGMISGEERFIKQWLKTMDTLMDRQSPSGQIPNCVDTFIPTRPRLIALGAADASLWFLITLGYAERLLGTHPEFHEAAERAFVWLKYQDAHEDGLIEQQEASDWMDIIANHGHVLYTNILYFAALELRGRIKRAHLVREAVNGYLWRNRRFPYFVPWEWKQEYGEWFDTAANCFAIAFGLADEDQTNSILDFIDEHKVDEPYPVRTILPSIEPGARDWREYYRTEHGLNIPGQYHNGGVWPWVGGLYVAALVRAGRLERARDTLYRLAQANKIGREHEWEFNEWIHGVTGEPKGSPDQAWSAGMYMYAYNCVKEGCEPVLDVLESQETQLLHNVHSHR